MQLEIEWTKYARTNSKVYQKLKLMLKLKIKANNQKSI